MTARINDLLFSKLEKHITNNLDKYARPVLDRRPSRPVVVHTPSRRRPVPTPEILSIIDNKPSLVSIVVNCKSITVLSDTVVILFPNDEYEIYPFAVSDYSTIDIY